MALEVLSGNLAKVLNRNPPASRRKPSAAPQISPAVAQPSRALPSASLGARGNSVPPACADTIGLAPSPYTGAQQSSHSAPSYRMPSSQHSTRHTYPNQQYHIAPTQFVATPARAHEFRSNQAAQSTRGAQSTQARPSAVQIPAASSSSSLAPEQYACQFCCSSFGRQYDRKRHYESHHASPESRPRNVCSGCGKNFGRTDTLTRHIDSQACTGGTTSGLSPQLAASTSRPTSITYYPSAPHIPGNDILGTIPSNTMSVIGSHAQLPSSPKSTSS
ncbi:hypothetical protein JAAARDRAFT_404721 [Jaapia argillacea MUCL 33604]|uniref:C2H2-type domain-containing protein n=1 Tax=Jaapia argillacea MUCL 33604 TaxID=933084 RepID=A0A067PHC1_9AGAM|nr:hypothetical protein JAAARDRAFT_404721 [Jaapia argillacea MUCL 33604]